MKQLKEFLEETHQALKEQEGIKMEEWEEDFLKSLKKAKKIEIKKFKHFDKITLYQEDFKCAYKTKKGIHFEDLHPEIQRVFNEKIKV